MADVKGLIADPDFQKLPPAAQRQALQGVTGDQSFASLSDMDTAHFISQLGGGPPDQSAPAATPRPKPSAPWRFVQNFANTLGAPERLSDIWEGPAYALRHPIDSAEMVGSAILNGQASLATRAKQDWQNKDYVGAATHGLEYLIPFFGPPLAKAGDQLESGDIAGGLGTTAGVGISLAGPEGVAKGSSAARDFLGPLFQKSAEAGYSKFLNPTTKPTKFTTRQVVPELLDRGVTATSPAALATKAYANAEPIGAEIGHAVDALPPFQKPPITAPYRLLPAAPTEVPLAASAPGRMPGALMPAGMPPIPESAFDPEARIAAGDSGISPIRLTDATTPDAPWRYSTTGPRTGTPEVPPAPQSEQGMMVTRDPAIANQFQTPTARQLPKEAQRVVDRLEQYKSNASVNGVPVDAAAVTHAGELQDLVRALGPDVSPQSLNRLRQIWDDKVAQGGGYAGKTLAEGSMIDAQKEGADAIRGVFAEDHPDIAKLNAEFHFWRGVGDVASATEKRQTGQQGPLARIFAPIIGASGFGAAGLIHGGGVEGAIGAALGSATMLAASEAIRSPYFRTLSAVQKAALADAISKMDVPTIKAISQEAATTGAAMGAAEYRYVAPPADSKKWRSVSGAASAP